MSDYFNPDEVTGELGGYGALPKGDYLCCVEDCEERIDKFDNPFIKFTLAVTEGPSKGRKVFNNLYLNHPEWDVKNSRIIMKTLCGLTNIKLRSASDLANFVGLELLVTLGVYKEKNIINGMKLKPSANPVGDDIPL